MLLFKLVFLQIVFVIQFTGSQSQQECVHRDYNNGGTVCVCNSTYCDTLSPVQKLPASLYVIYTSNLAGLRFKKEEGQFSQTPGNTVNKINVDPSLQYQTIHGFGGAFTDATGININSLNDIAKDKLLRSYFTEEGIEYSLCRVPIGGTDFSTHGYTYNDGPVDVNLTNFRLASEDFQYKIPLILKAKNLTNNNLLFFASAWTAPKWIKTNGDYAGVGFIISSMYQTWANYFLRFLEAYKSNNIEFWGITTGNEPSLSYLPVSKINSVAWFPGQMSKWIEENLGPTLRSSAFSDIKLMALDDQRYLFRWFADLLFEKPAVKDYVDGLAVHWYWNKIIPASILSWTHDTYPDKFILATEACEGSESPESEKVILGSWQRGQNYANDILDNLNNWVTGWVDWNMALDTTGGPTYINNNVDSPIIVNKTAGEFYKQPMYYALGHFSKFIPRGSVKIAANRPSSSLKVTAIKRPDNGTVVVILNSNDVATDVEVADASRGFITLNITPKSITSILFW